MPPESNTHAERAPVWLDCDPAHHPNLKLLGVSSVHGNASLSHTTSNVGSILTAIGSPDIPYYAGAAKPLCREAVHAPEFHGWSSGYLNLDDRTFDCLQELPA
ncbi:MAG: hypothetical protein LQ350_001348 [Teloschistes chrysophthalmus]|nr:MAG: hypothetical protein LQ350_001348 [Niorma chrysophthalma]